MKNTLLLLVLSGGLLTACGGKPDLPQSCLDLVDTLSEMAKLDPTAAKEMPDSAEMIKELEAKWENMSDSEREKTANECKQTQAMMDGMMGMLKSMKDQ